MSARDALYWALWDNYTQAQKNAFIDAFAHELAEQQRAWANSEPRRTSTEYGVAMLMAHLIDPASKGAPK